MSYDKNAIKSPGRSPRKTHETPTPGHTPWMANSPQKLADGYDFKDDYNSSDYDYISDEEIEYMKSYQ